MAAYQPPKKGYYSHLRELVRNNPGAELPTLQRLAGLGDYAVQQEVSSDMYETPDQMIEDLEARREKERPAAAPRTQPVARPQRPEAFTSPQSERTQMFGPYEQMAMHRGMAQQAMGAIGDEMDSRVAQVREQRRLQHEKDMEQLRQDGILRRLQMESQATERQARLMQEMQDRAGGMIFSSRWKR